MSLPPPSELGAPARFSQWRGGQDDVLLRAMASPKRFPVIDCPTGVGKSLINITYATAQGMSEAYYTSTKGLQDQLQREFASIGLMDVRGMANYACLELPPGPRSTCDKGPCLEGGQCSLKFNGCFYYDALRTAAGARLCSTNYALALALARGDQTLGKRDVLVLDEAHDAAEHLAGAMRVTLDAAEVDHRTWPLDSPAHHIEKWKSWTWREHIFKKRELEELSGATGEEARELRRLVNDLARLASAEGEWVWRHEEGKVELEPVWAHRYAEQMLFRGVPKVLLSSATLRPAALKYLGLGPDDYEFCSALSPFPASRRPIYVAKNAPRVSWDMDDFDMRKWLDTVDDAIEPRLPWKGLIHSVSYERAKHLVAASRFAKHMILPTRRTTRESVERFKAMQPPAILISPSIHTGYDFAHEAARWQIITKVPFPPVAANPILAIRQAQDSGYRDWVTASTLIQTVGRVVRAADDLGETIITDAHAVWFLKKRALFPPWFLEAARVVDKIPPPLMAERNQADRDRREK